MEKKREKIKDKTLRGVEFYTARQSQATRLEEDSHHLKVVFYVGGSLAQLQAKVTNTGGRGWEFSFNSLEIGGKLIQDQEEM